MVIHGYLKKAGVIGHGLRGREYAGPLEAIGPRAARR